MDTTFDKNDCNGIARALFKNLTEGYNYHKTGSIRENRLLSIGNAKVRELGLIEKLSLEKIIEPQSLDVTIHMYERFIYKNILIHSQNYQRLEKRNNSVIETTDGQFISVDGLVKVKTLDGDNNWLIEEDSKY